MKQFNIYSVTTDEVVEPGKTWNHITYIHEDGLETSTLDFIVDELNELPITGTKEQLQEAYG